MIKESYNVIGVMSGTSLDGIDLAHIYFKFDRTGWQYEIREACTKPYSNAWLDRLKDAVNCNTEELKMLDKEYTVLLAGIITDFINDNSLSGIDAVCSHGHTILHQPYNKITFQAGNQPELATLVGTKVVCDFRVQDVALGGQGAPLVPIGDQILFRDYTFCLNLGGFSNISFYKGQERRAFDICAVNTVLNYYANQLGYEYDDKGNLAQKGAVNADLLGELNELPFYNLSYPKSLGYEFVKASVLPLIDKYDIPVFDKLATYTEHIAVQLAAAIGNIASSGSLLITGGGAYNDFLIGRITQLLPGLLINVPDDKTVQFKEALIFALLGVLRLRGQANVLASVTGALEDHCAGYIYEPK